MRIRIVASSRTDPWARYLGRLYDQDLVPCNWYNQQPHSIVNVGWSPLVWEEDVPPGASRISIAVSSFGEAGFWWDVSVYLDNKLIGTKTVDCHTPVIFNIAPAAPVPSRFNLVTAMAIGILALGALGFGVVATRRRRKL